MSQGDDWKLSVFAILSWLNHLQNPGEPQVRVSVRYAAEVPDWTSAVIVLLYLFSLSLARLVPLRSHIPVPSNAWPTIASTQSYNSKQEGKHTKNATPKQLHSDPGLSFRPQIVAAGYFTNDSCWQIAKTDCTGVDWLSCAHAWAASTLQKNKIKSQLMCDTTRMPHGGWESRLS